MRYSEFYKLQNENLFTKPRCNKVTHEEIDRQIQEFLQRGGKIQHVASYASNFDNFKFNTPKHNVHEAYYKPVEAVHEETGRVIRFEYLNEVKKRGFSSSSVGQICRQKSKRIHKGYRWRYL